MTTSTTPTTPRIFNFSAGPAVLPEEVLLEARDNLLSLGNLGLGILEISHRAKEFEAILGEAEQNLRDLMGLAPAQKVLFLHGGATLQFSMVPMNLLAPGGTADYVVTGEWSKKAVIEAQRVGQVHLAGSSEGEQFRRIPRSDELRFSPSPAYVHTTSNNTIWGTQWQVEPETGGAPLLNVFGGKITTYRRLAESALAKLAPFFPQAGGKWTAGVALPGGDFPVDGVEALTMRLQAAYPFLSPRDTRRP